MQVGHATAVRVERNEGAEIGYPEEDVDVEGGGVPVAIDTAGNVERAPSTPETASRTSTASAST